MTLPMWVALVAVVVAVLSLGLCVVFWQRRHFDAVRFADLRRERDYARGRVEALLITSSGDDAEIERLRRRLQLVEGLLSRSAWINGCDFTMRLSADDAVAMREELERCLLESDASILDFCMEVSRDRALLTIEELRRIENHPADDDDGVTS